MPKRNTKRILAIDPGAREMGVAVLEGGHLLYAGVESLRKFPSQGEQIRHAHATVTRLIRDFGPDVLALEKNFISKTPSTSSLNALVTRIMVLGRRHGLTIIGLAANTVRKTLTGNGWATKQEIARAVAAKFPKLKAHLPPDRKWKRAYRLNLFDAVAVGMATLAMEKQNRSP